MEVDCPTSAFCLKCVIYSPKTTMKSEINVELDSVDISVNSLKSLITKRHQIEDNERIELIDRGRKMNDGDTLTSFDLQSTSKLQAVIKFKQTAPEDNVPTRTQIDDAKRDLKTLMIPKNYKAAFYLLNKPETIKNMVSEIPTLGNDVTARVILKNVRLVKVILKHTVTQDRDKLVDNIVRKHQSIIEAIPLLLQLVLSSENIPKSELQTNNYYLDGQSDDEEDTPMRYVQRHMPTNQGQPQPSQTAAAGNITISQLQSALQNATAASTSSQSTAPNSSQIPQPSASNPFSALQNPAVVYKSQLEQLRAMGINDDAVSIQALVATNGNLERALEIIYGSM